jgi:hypothetical protein
MLKAMLNNSETLNKLAPPHIVFYAIITYIKIIMDHNKRLVPICIIYLDGVRLEQKYEGALYSVVSIDRMDGVGQCKITFDYSELAGEDVMETFPYYTKVSVHMGYKDDTREVFNGEITGVDTRLKTYASSLFSVTASSLLHRLSKETHTRILDNKTPSQAIEHILGLYDLKSDCASFGPKREHWEGGQKTDLELVLDLSKKYGKDVCVFFVIVYVKELMTHLQDEIVYEWGKSLINFEVNEDIGEQVSDIQFFGWNYLDNKGFRSTVKIGDISQKIGGRMNWTDVSLGGRGMWKDYHYDPGIGDAEEAKELALALMREKSFNFIRAEGSVEGDSRLTAGATVMIKYVGNAGSGEYIAECVVHRFTLSDGYTTEFYLKRNMLNEETMKKAGSGAVLGFSGGSTGNPKAANASDIDDDDIEFANLVWKKDGNEVSEALVDDEVTINFDVRNIDDGASVNVIIFEYDADEEHDHIKDLTGKVKDGKVEIPWKVEYHFEILCKIMKINFIAASSFGKDCRVFRFR